MRIKLAAVQIAVPLFLGCFPIILLLIAGRLRTGTGCAFSSASPGYRTLLAVVAVFTAILVPAIIIGVRRMVVTPLRNLAAIASDFPGDVPPLMRERYVVAEVNEIARSINDMMEVVMSREEALNDLNESLEDRIYERTKAHQETIETLRSARDRLFLSQKMAALGSLVSGVSHEINTPLSIGVTAASFLNERTRALRGDFESQSLTQEDLERFLLDSEEASGIIQRNLDQAARIIASLKQVAIDQQSDEKREFELRSYLEDVAMSLKHLLRPGKHEMTVESGGVVFMNSYPGALSRIINNFVLNSVAHGFAGREGGEIRILCRQEGNEAVLEYRDDGCGFDRETYEMIVAEKGEEDSSSGSGERGLGMAIVSNLVDRRLKGTLEIPPPDGGGACFIIRMPKSPDEEVQ